MKSFSHITLQYFLLLKNFIETYEIWREKSPIARPNMDSNELARMRSTIIKNKMENDEIILRVQSKCKNRLPNVEANNNSSHSNQHHIIQPNEDIESQNTPSLQTQLNPELISNNVQNALSPELRNIDPQS